METCTPKMLTFHASFHKQQQHHFHCTVCFKVTPNMEHTSLIWGEEPPTAQSRLSVQIMSEHRGARPLIWSQTHQDKQGKNASAASSHLYKLEWWSERENVQSCWTPRPTDHHLLFSLLWRAPMVQAELSESFGAAAEIQRCRYWTTQRQTAPTEMSYRMRANISQLSYSFQHFFAGLFVFQKRRADGKKVMKIWVFI